MFSKCPTGILCYRELFCATVVFFPLNLIKLSGLEFICLIIKFFVRLFLSHIPLLLLFY